MVHFWHMHSHWDGPIAKRWVITDQWIIRPVLLWQENAGSGKYQCQTSGKGPQRGKMAPCHEGVEQLTETNALPLSQTATKAIMHKTPTRPRSEILTLKGKGKEFQQLVIRRYLKKLAPCGTDGRLLRNVNTFMLICLKSVLPVSVEKLPKAETSISVFFSQ